MSIWKKGMETANLLWKQQTYGNKKHRMSVNSFFPRTAMLWNSLPIEECFPLTYDLNGFKSIINKLLLTVGSF